MSTSLLFFFLLSLFFLLFCCLENWLYVCLLSLVELLWVFLVCIFSSLSLEFFEVALYYWSISWLFLATVESIAGVFVFVLYNQLSGQAYV